MGNHSDAAWKWASRHYGSSDKHELAEAFDTGRRYALNDVARLQREMAILKKAIKPFVRALQNAGLAPLEQATPPEERLRKQQAAEGHYLRKQEQHEATLLKE